MRQGWSLRLLKRLWNILVAGCWLLVSAHSPPPKIDQAYSSQVGTEIWLRTKYGCFLKLEVPLNHPSRSFFWISHEINHPAIKNPPAIGNPPYLHPHFLPDARRPYMDLPPVPSALVKSPPWIMKSCRRISGFLWNWGIPWESIYHWFFGYHV